MDSWRDLAASILGEGSASETPANAPPPADLPLSVEQGLRALAGMAPPPRLSPASRPRWNQVKEDAAGLVADGWAAQALGLGWHPLELFGCGQRSSADFAGVAIWLQGRSVVLIDDASAMAREGSSYSIFTRSAQSEALSDPATLAFLWEMGRK